MFAVETLAKSMIHEALHACEFNAQGGKGQGLFSWLRNVLLGDEEVEIVERCFK